MKEIDRNTVEMILRNRTRDMIEKEVPGFADSQDGRDVLDRFHQSPGFQALITRQVAELEARMKGQVH